MNLQTIQIFLTDLKYGNKFFVLTVRAKRLGLKNEHKMDTVAYLVQNKYIFKDELPFPNTEIHTFGHSLSLFVKLFDFFFVLSPNELSEKYFGKKLCEGHVLELPLAIRLRDKARL